ncbi:hypothetical protein F0726_00147 [Acidithiobacillus caldus]|nr:hypothetical protein F0726_00147 [Acidithiobacillus caldus]
MSRVFRCAAPLFADRSATIGTGRVFGWTKKHRAC